MDSNELDRIFSEVGGRNSNREDLEKVLLQRERITNWQLRRILEGHRRGYFYGNWKVLYLVGAGTFARVYRCEHVNTHDVRALKVLRNRYSDDIDTRERFLREAKTVIKLRHPNIVPIHEVDEDQGRVYMVMDFIEGQNLRDHVRMHNQIGLMVAMNIIRDLASGLDYADKMGITHRDIKLSNVLLSSSGRASLVDFGLATVNQPDDDDTHEFNPRSIDYAGLERVTNVPRDDRRSDIYFLGCMLYHMLSGKSPLLETRERIKRLNPSRFKDVEPITNLVKGLPSRVVVFIRRMMELDPEKRLKTPGIVLAEAELIIDAIREGKADKYSDELSALEAEAFEKKQRKSTEGYGKTIMLVESNAALQDSLRNRLKKIGYRVLIISDPSRALARFEFLDPAEDDPADCLIFGCNGLGVDGINAFREFTSDPKTKKYPSILLIKAGQSKITQSIQYQSHHRCVQMPMKFRELRELLREMLKIEFDSVVMPVDDEAEV
jgi:eukaryotic-like serine/threonine-protein kinase